VAKRLETVTLSFSRPVSEEGVMFGSVAKSDLIKNLAAADIKVDKDMIRLPASLNAVGTHEVEIALKHDIVAKVKVALSAQSK
jgi:ribosomal protein L9